jgi:hypothetical protein
MRSRSSCQMQKMVEYVLVDVLVSCFVMWVLLCCLLQVNWFKSCVVKACYAKVQNNTIDRFCFDALHVFGNDKLSRSVGG